MGPALSFKGAAISLIGQGVTVIGAGIAGLAVARALALRGASVTVLEQADALTDIGAGLQVSPNGAAVLRALGLQGALDAASTRARAVQLIDGPTGRLVTRLDLARLRPGQGYHFLHRADLIAILRDATIETGVTLRLSAKVTSVDLTADRPNLTLTTGERLDTPLLIGADGLHSLTRTALNGPETPFFTHQVAWRALIPCDPGTDPVAEVHMAPRRHLVSYPLRGGTLRNIVAVEERTGWAAESWSGQDDPANLRRAFAGFSPRVTGWLDQVDTPGLWGLFRHPVAARWTKTLPDGAALILGDAAHPTLPFLAQGASMGLEDAWVLAEALASHDSLDAALAAYQSARKPRATRIVAAADANARAYHLSGLSRTLGHTVLRTIGRLAPGLLLSRLDWLYGHDVTARSAAN
jgi:salicylate hydroxylase